MLIRHVELGCSGVTADVRIGAGLIQAIGRLRREPGEVEIAGQGYALLPGLRDHHLHLQALAAAQRSVACGPPEVEDAPTLIARLRAADAAAAPGEWLRGTGYHDAVAGALDRDVLDQILPLRPLRIQHRSGRLWILNSAALKALFLAADDAAPFEQINGRLTGRLYDADRWLRARLRGQPPSLARVSADLAGRGVTAITDASPDNGPTEFAHFQQQQAQGALRQSVLMMGSMALRDVTETPELRVGPLKVHLHEAHLPPFDALVHTLREGHSEGRAAAFHCVSRVELTFALAALREAGTRVGDRIEHAGVTPPDLLEQLRELRLIVVTQPNFIAERGDAYLAEVDPEDRPWLYRLRAFVEAGIPLAGSTDAPFGKADPWRAMAAAVDRRTGKGAIVGRDEALSPEQALGLFLSPLQSPGDAPLPLHVGARADLCLIDRPWAAARTQLAAVQVVATWRNGVPIHSAEPSVAELGDAARSAGQVGRSS